MYYVGKTDDNPIVAISQEFYENAETLPDTSPDGTIKNDGTILNGKVNVDGYCDDVYTGYGFGEVNYRKFDQIEFVPFDKKNIITESSTSARDCATKCFQKAGCSAFFKVGNDCSYIIGTASQRKENNAVTDAGMLSRAVCPTSAFTTTYTKKSNCVGYVATLNEAENVADRIVQENTGNSNTPLRTWTFTTTNQYPMVKSSQYISVEIEEYGSYKPGYRKGPHFQ